MKTEDRKQVVGKGAKRSQKEQTKDRNKARDKKRKRFCKVEQAN